MTENEQYIKLKNLLNKQYNWPVVYMFKFIVPANNRSIALVESKFSDEAIITQKQSTNGKYFSITVKEVMFNADAVIDTYKQMEGIEGLMAL